MSNKHWKTNHSTAKKIWPMVLALIIAIVLSGPSLAETIRETIAIDALALSTDSKVELVKGDILKIYVSAADVADTPTISSSNPAVKVLGVYRTKDQLCAILFADQSGPSKLTFSYRPQGKLQATSVEVSANVRSAAASRLIELTGNNLTDVATGQTVSTLRVGDLLRYRIAAASTIEYVASTTTTSPKVLAKVGVVYEDTGVYAVFRAEGPGSAAITANYKVLNESADGGFISGKLMSSRS